MALSSTMLENAPYENEEDHAFNEFAFWRRPISVLNLNEGSGRDEEFHYWHRRPSNLVGSFFDRSGEEHGGVSAESSASCALRRAASSPRMSSSSLASFRPPSCTRLRRL